MARIADLREPFAGVAQDKRAAVGARVHRLGDDFNAMCGSTPIARASKQVIAGDVFRNVGRCAYKPYYNRANKQGQRQGLRNVNPLADP